MSATGRSDVRVKDDVYTTPPWVVHRLLEKISLPPGSWLDPAVGDGAIVKAVNAKLGGVNWRVNDIRSCVFDFRGQDGVDMCLQSDFLRWSTDVSLRSDVVIGNPPYSYALDFIEESLSCARKYVVMLLRLGFLASRQRREFMQEYPPDVYVLPNRPSFDGKGTDSADYGWYVWDVDNLVRPHGRIVVLDETPLEERKRAIS